MEVGGAKRLLVGHMVGGVHSFMADWVRARSGSGLAGAAAWCQQAGRPGGKAVAVVGVKGA